MNNKKSVFILRTIELKTNEMIIEGVYSTLKKACLKANKLKLDNEQPDFFASILSYEMNKDLNLI